MRLKVVIDTNIAICSTKTVFEEFAKVIGYPRFQKRLAKLGLEVEEVIDYYEDMVSLYKENASTDVVKEDDSDNRFIEAAIDSDSCVIVTGDEHLLEIKEFNGIMILKPKEFLEAYIKS